MSTPGSQPFAATVYERLLESIPKAEDGRRAWQVADPYVLRHAAQHAVHAGRAGELLQDPGFLINADADTVNAILRKATTQSERLTAAVYRTSYTLLRTLAPEERQHILVLNAARFQARELAAELARGASWSPLWATGSQVSASNTAILTGHTDAVNAVATTQINDSPVAITGSDDNTIRVWDLITGRTTAILTGHTDTVNAVATTQINDSPVAITGSDDNTIRVWDLITGRT
ncbi:hypothetical protein ACH4A5_16820, partial [Streptomyces lydicus]